MVVRDRTRAISTVMDVSLALLIISATVLMVGLYLHNDSTSIDGNRGDHALQTLSGSTVTFTYDLSAKNEAGYAATDSEHYELPDEFDENEVGELYEITTYGSATSHLGDAALTSIRIDDEQVFHYGHEVERSVEAAIQGRSVGSEGHMYTIATWEPYRGSEITGTVTVGDPPTELDDVSSSTLEVSGNIEPVDSEYLATLFEQGEDSSPDRSSVDDGFDLVGQEIAQAVIDGYFPPKKTQYTLESSLTENAVTLYNYRRMAETANVDIEDQITSTAPNARDANSVLVSGDSDDNGLASFIAEDLRQSPAGENIRTTYDGFDGNLSPSDRDELVAVFSEEVSTDSVEITVQTWD